MTVFGVQGKCTSYHLAHLKTVSIVPVAYGPRSNCIFWDRQRWLPLVRLLKRTALLHSNPTRLCNGCTSADRNVDRGYAYSPSGPSEELGSGRRSADIYGGGEGYPDNATAASMSRHKPSQDLVSFPGIPVRCSDEHDMLGANIRRRLCENVSTRSKSAAASNAQSATAGMGMIIPNESTIAEEDIEVLYRREVQDSGSPTIDDRIGTRPRRAPP